MATLSRLRARAQQTLARNSARTWPAALLDFWLCASWGWLCLLLLEVSAGSPEPLRLVQRVLFLVALACRYSALFGLPLLALHGLRIWLLGRGLRADRLLGALLLVLLFMPSYQQADLLTGGTLLLDSRYAMPLRALFVVSLLGGNLLLLRLHLLLCRAPGVSAPFLGRFARAALGGRWFNLLLVFVPGAIALAVFVDTVEHGLRAYLFFSQFLLPSAWLLAGSLLFALRLRAQRARTWLRVFSLSTLAIGALGSVLLAQDVRKAKAEFERRGGVIALTELAVSRQHGAPYANLDVSRPAQFRCPPPTAASPDSSLPTPQRDRQNVILISVDTLRKDALTMLSDGRPAAPFLRAFAERSLSFERAVTSYPATLFALSSALTGQSASEVLFSPRPLDNLFTLTQRVFRQRLVALPNVGWFQRAPVPQLITQVAAPGYFRDAESSTTWMIARLRQARALRQRSFAWIHYFEPHASKVTGRGAEAVRSDRRSYAQLVHQVDLQIGRLMQALERDGYLRDSLVIVFSDHGEALGELDYFGHHVYLNQFATDVPLFVHAPGIVPRRSERQVTLADIAPTVLEWVGSPAPPGEALSLFSDDRAEERYALSEAFPLRGRALYELARVPISDVASLQQRMRLIRTAAFDYQPKVSLVSSRYRLIVNRLTGAEEFYDRVRDPGEEHDLSQDGLPAQATLRNALRGWNARLSERIYCRVQVAASDAGRASAKP